MVTSLLISNKSLPGPVLFKGTGYAILIPGGAVNFACQIPTETATQDLNVLIANAPSLEITIIGAGEGVPGPLIGENTPVVLMDVDYQGVWDASSGQAPHEDPEPGWYWRVIVSGEYELDGIASWLSGEFEMVGDALDESRSDPTAIDI